MIKAADEIFRLQEENKRLKENAIIIPEGATNGDVIKAMFPNAETWVEFDSNGDVMRFDIAENSTLECFNLKWWNAPYKTKSEG